MSRIIDPFDELAQLFLTDGEDDAAPRSANVHEEQSGRAPGEHAPVELLLVGHLPVRADLWLRPYAEAMSRSAGTVALVRLDADEPSVEVLGGSGEAISELGGRSLRDAVRELSPRVDLWIVRPPASTSAAHLSAEADARLTIISSADETALVAAYHRIKDLADAARAADVELPQLGIAILGSAEATAQGMVDRLNRTTRTFLGMEIPLVTTLRQMEAGSRSQAYARFLGERSPAAAEFVAWIREEAASAAPMLPVRDAEPSANEPVEQFRFSIAAARAQLSPGQPRSANEPPPSPISESTPRAKAALELREEIVDEPVLEASSTSPRAHEPIAAEPAPADLRSHDREVLELLRETLPQFADGAKKESATVEAAPAAPASSESPAAAKLAPKPAMVQEVQLAAASPGHETAAAAIESLASFVPGLTAVPLRCPGHERIELAVDADGRFHVLCREDAMRELHLVEAWTRSHHELLTMALPQFLLKRDAPPVKHVFTDKPITVADLHGSSLNLHVLAPVVVDGKTGWYAAPLNNPK